VLPEFPLIEKGGVEALHLLDRHGIEDTAVGIDSDEGGVMRFETVQ
jgi:hypothetical protein